MRFKVFAATAAMLIAGLAMLVLVNGRTPGASAQGAAGPQIDIGTPSLAAGELTVPIITSGSAPNAYNGFNVQLRWDAAVFSFSSFNTNGAVVAWSLCPAAFQDATTGPGGVVASCLLIGAGTNSVGVLGNIVLTPVAAGCSNLHLVTVAEANDPTHTYDTYTLDAIGNAPQDNTYGPDVAVDQAGAPCTPGATPTPTATPTEIPAPPTNTPAPATPICGGPGEPPCRTVTPTPTNTVVETPTEVPATETPVPPTGQEPPPGGGAQGQIVPPRTGSGGTTAGSDGIAWWAMALAGAAVIVTGAGYAARKWRTK